MAELRKDYLLDRYVIIATERAKRPDQFAVKQETSGNNGSAVVDYFAPGNEHTTPPEKGHIGDPWRIRWFDNKFYAVDDKYDSNLGRELKTDNSFYTFAKAFGVHEVIVETPDTRQLWDLSDDEILDVLKVYRSRIVELSKKEGIRYVQVFKNSGREAGCSVQHSHSQVIALNIVPPDVTSEENAVFAYESKNLRNPYDDLLKSEIGSYREISNIDGIFTFCPYASRYPMEVRIMPTRNVVHMEDLSDSELEEISVSLGNILRRLRKIGVSYNIFVRNGLMYQRFYIDVLPRPITWAGFEMSTGIIINPVLPEDAAKFYRQG